MYVVTILVLLGIIAVGSYLYFTNKFTGSLEGLDYLGAIFVFVLVAGLGLVVAMGISMKYSTYTEVTSNEVLLSKDTKIYLTKTETRASLLGDKTVNWHMSTDYSVNLRDYFKTMKALHIDDFK